MALPVRGVVTKPKHIRLHTAFLPSSQRPMFPMFSREDFEQLFRLAEDERYQPENAVAGDVLMRIPNKARRFPQIRHYLRDMYQKSEGHFFIVFDCSSLYKRKNEFLAVSHPKRQNHIISKKKIPRSFFILPPEFHWVMAHIENPFFECYNHPTSIIEVPLGGL